MTTGKDETQVVRLAAWSIVAATTICALYLGREIIIPLVVAFLIGFALNPLVTYLTRLGLPRLLSVCAVMLSFGLILAALGLLVGSQVRTLSAELPSYQSTIREKIKDLGQRMRSPGLFDGAMKTAETVKKEVGANLETDTKDRPTQQVEVVETPTSPFKTAVSLLLPALEPLATFGIVVIFIFLVLLDRSDLRDRLIRLLGGNLHRSTDAIEDAGQRISKYLLMQLVVNVSYGIPMAAGLWLIGVPGWLLWGALAALMRFIPYLGPLLSAVFPLALAFAVDPGWNMVLWTLALILVLELISNNIVEPLLYGTSTGLSGISLIAAATFWTTLWGPVGLILSTPLTVCLLVLGRTHPQLQFLDTILGSTPALDIPTRIYQRLIAADSEEAIEIIDESIEDDAITDFYHEHGIEVLRRISEDYLSNARAEHRLRIANGLDALLDGLREQYPPKLDATLTPQVACIGGKWEIDSVACEMLIHALALEGVPATLRREGRLTGQYIDALELDDIRVVCVSYFTDTPASSIKALCRRLRHRWPNVKIVVAIWNGPEQLLDSEEIRKYGADEAVNSIREAIGRIQQMLAPAAPDRQENEKPEHEDDRVKALLASDVLDGHLREELDGFAKRAADVFNVKYAMISVVDAGQAIIVGQNSTLPGHFDHNTADMIVIPRKDALSDLVVLTGELVNVPDARRDPRFSDHAIIKNWDVRFYASAPLKTSEGYVLGTFSLLDTEPRTFADDDAALLNAMAADVVSKITGDEPVKVDATEGAQTPTSTVGQKVPE